MGLLSGIAKKVGSVVVGRKAEKYSKPEEADALATSLMEGSMSPKTKKWAEALVWALVGGLIAPLLDLLSVGHLPPLHGPEGAQLVHLSITTAILAFCTYLRKHPRPDDAAVELDPDTLVRMVVDAAQNGLLSRAHARPLDAAASQAYRLPTPPTHPGAGPALVLLPLMLLGTTAAHAADAPPPVHVDVAGGLEVSRSDAGTKPTPFARVSITGPLAIGHGASDHGFVEAVVDLRGVPGETAQPDVTAISNWTGIGAHGSLGWTIGALNQGGQEVRSHLLLSGGFRSKLGNPEPAARVSRDIGLYIEFAELVGGARVRLGYGHDDSVSEEWGRGHLCVSGVVPISATRGIVSIGGDAALGLGHPEGITTHDQVSLAVMLSPPTRSGPSTPAPTASARLQAAGRTSRSDLATAAALMGPPSPEAR